MPDQTVRAADRREASRPDLMAAMMQMREAMKANQQLPDRLVELMRLRIAFRNQCRPCMSMRYEDAIQDGLTEDLVCAIEHPDEPSDLTASERVAVRFGDKFATNHLSIGPADHAALAEHFSPAEIAELGVWAAFFTGFGRMGAVFDNGEAAYPVGPRDPEGRPLTPWGVAAPIVMSAPNS
ncbi:MAG: carboxymuconolactone decarboxylase family protein [Hyphomonadaceae bacterium]|nr:carboxymuconolactone decarboxylase family protein [Hyphomonadaceae bacterium]